jgi:cytochrome P450
MGSVTRPAHDSIDLASRTIWELSAAERDAVFAKLRSTRPVSWQAPADTLLTPPWPDDEGWWAVTGHAEVVSVSRRPQLFCSSRGFMFENYPPEAYQAGSSILLEDPPRHTLMRMLVSSAFTPRRIKQIDGQIARQAATIVDDLLSGGSGEGDFVRDVSQRLPMWTISEMVGIPPERRDEVAAAANMVNAPESDGERDVYEVYAASTAYLNLVALELAEERRRHPEDDVMTALVQARVDDVGLTDEEIGAFFLLLTVAGTDTTRNTTSITVKALSDHADQRQLLASDIGRYMSTAVEEFLRWATPVMTFRRTATSDVELAGQHIREGDRVVMFYASANFDEKVFDDPHRFDVTRHPNPHVAFGGGGPHFCLGAQLARAQLRTLFTELLTRVPDLEIGEPRFEANDFIREVKGLPYRYKVRA